MWSGDQSAARRLRTAWQASTLAICPIVYTELFAHQGADRAFIDAFLLEVRIEMVNVTPDMWLVAGERYASMAMRRRAGRGDQPRRIAADFVIGAHALLLGNTLLTSDKEMYERNFRELRLP